MSFLEAEDGGAEQHTAGREDIGDVPDRHGLVRLRSPQAVEDVGQRHRVERTLDRRFCLASTVVGCIAASLRDVFLSTFGFGSSRVISFSSGGAAFSRK